MNTQSKDFIPPKYDRMFKAVFTENINCLKNFVASLTGIPIDKMKNFRLRNTELIATNKESKMPRLDLLLEFNNNIVNIEIQLWSKHDFIERSLLYWARLYSANTKIGMDYSVSPQVICINILNYTLFDNDDKPKHQATIQVDDTIKKLTDKFRIDFFELPKISDEIDPNNDVKLWLQFLKAKNGKELQMVKDSGNTAVAEAVDSVILKNEEWHKQMREIMEDMARMDEEAVLGRARKEGKDEGIKEGIKEGIEEGIKKGIEKEKNEWICRIKASGLPQEEIDKLLA